MVGKSDLVKYSRCGNYRESIKHLQLSGERSCRHASEDGGMGCLLKERQLGLGRETLDLGRG